MRKRSTNFTVILPRAPKNRPTTCSLYYQANYQPQLSRNANSTDGLLGSCSDRYGDKTVYRIVTQHHTGICVTVYIGASGFTSCMGKQKGRMNQIGRESGDLQ